MNAEVKIYDPTVENTIKLTPAAVNHIKKDLEKHKAKGLRLAVKTGGCSGLKYVESYVYEIDPCDEQFNIDGLQIFIEPKSLDALKGITLDYVQEGLNWRLKYINPNEKGSCGCGESFMV